MLTRERERVMKKMRSVEGVSFPRESRDDWLEAWQQHMMGEQTAFGNAALRTCTQTVLKSRALGVQW